MVRRLVYRRRAIRRRRRVTQPAASPDRPEHLVGLLLAAPGSRGRFGLTSSDLLGVAPGGPNTFALADMAPNLAGLRVAQFVAGLDPMDDTVWLDHLGCIPHKHYPLYDLLQDMGGAGERFLRTVDEAMAWTLEQN